MTYFEKNDFITSLKQKKDFHNMVQIMTKDVDYFFDSFEDSSNRISRWGHLYFCEIDGGSLIFELDKPNKHVCSVCGKTYSSEMHEGVWIYHYRNAVVLTLWKSALLYQATGQDRFLKYIISTLKFYTTHYLSFSLHNKEGFVYDSLNTMQWGCGRLMPQGLNESIFVIRLINALEIVKHELPPALLESINEDFFTEVFKLLKPQVDKIHNIPTWNNCAIGAMGLFSNNQTMIDFAFHGPYGIYEQIKHGVTVDGFWFEGSIHYNFFTLEGLMNLTLFAHVYNYSFEASAKETLKKMLIAAYDYAFDTHRLPNPNDGWPNINLQTYTHVYALAVKAFNMDKDLLIRYYNIKNNPQNRVKLPLSDPYYFDNRISLEELTLLPTLDVGHSTALPSLSINFESSQYAILKNDSCNVFLKYGHNGPSHAHPDKMNIEVMIKGHSLSRDLSNAGYGAKLCNEWHRVTASHNTVVINGKNHVSMEQGETLLFEPQHMIAKATDVYRVPSSLDVGKMKSSMNKDEIIRYLTKNLSMTELEASDAFKEGKNLSTIIQSLMNKAPIVDFTRSITLFDDGFEDVFYVNADQQVMMDYFFHVEPILLTPLKTTPATLGFSDFGYQHLMNIQKVETDSSSISLEWELHNLIITSYIMLGTQTLYLADSYDNPITKHRKTLILRTYTNQHKFNIRWTYRLK